MEETAAGTQEYSFDISVCLPEDSIPLFGLLERVYPLVADWTPNIVDDLSTLIAECPFSNLVKLNFDDPDVQQTDTDTDIFGAYSLIDLRTVSLSTTFFRKFFSLENVVTAAARRRAPCFLVFAERIFGLPYLLGIQAHTETAKETFAAMAVIAGSGKVSRVAARDARSIDLLRKEVTGASPVAGTGALFVYLIRLRPVDSATEQPPAESDSDDSAPPRKKAKKGGKKAAAAAAAQPAAPSVDEAPLPAPYVDMVCVRPEERALLLGGATLPPVRMLALNGTQAAAPLTPAEEREVAVPVVFTEALLRGAMDTMAELDAYFAGRGFEDA